MEYYLEMREKETADNMFKPTNFFRKYVKDAKEAESEYVKQKDNFVDEESLFVEMNHDKDPKKNKPCVAKKLVNGKVEQ